MQAPIGSGATPELVAAVTGAGALGMLAMSWTEPDAIPSEMQRTRALTPRPFGVNFVLEWDQRERLEICLEEGARIVSYFWSIPRAGESVRRGSARGRRNGHAHRG